ncbi:MAG: hypothetical protein AVDCRST_MAG26-2429 [uncultured Chloroflexia bacterium]|uniref:Uncharacterized protein n=1 Tax=uncultured Chloroflexia bacterium TaxID=1672391 RepID=A0A6J4IYU6_9CHLR|nr:MAG: hypothetical protein AVDCRST_MAG26-2429 [uncultured Chloroflexia bacterium]
MAVPARLSRACRQQSKHGAQQRRLPRADPPSDDGERAARQPQIDALDAAIGVRIAEGQAADLQRFEPVLACLRRIGNLGQCAVHVDRTVRHKSGGRSALE